MDRLTKHIPIAQKFFIKEEISDTFSEDDIIFIEELLKVDEFLSKNMKLSKYLALINLKVQLSDFLKRLVR